MRRLVLIATLISGACTAPAARVAPEATTTVTERRLEPAKPEMARSAEPAHSPAPAVVAAHGASGEAPVYPEKSRRLREEGTVELTFEVLQSGAVRTIEIARSSGYERLDEAALTAARTWRFNPRTGGGTVEVLLHRVVFRLTD